MKFSGTLAISSQPTGSLEALEYWNISYRGAHISLWTGKFLENSFALLKNIWILQNIVLITPWYVPVILLALYRECFLHYWWIYQNSTKSVRGVCQYFTLAIWTHFFTFLVGSPNLKSHFIEQGPEFLLHVPTNCRIIQENFDNDTSDLLKCKWAEPFKNNRAKRLSNLYVVFQ